MDKICRSSLGEQQRTTGVGGRDGFVVASTPLNLPLLFLFLFLLLLLLPLLLLLLLLL